MNLQFMLFAPLLASFCPINQPSEGVSPVVWLGWGVSGPFSTPAVPDWRIFQSDSCSGDSQRLMFRAGRRDRTPAICESQGPEHCMGTPMIGYVLGSALALIAILVYYAVFYLR